MRTSTQLTYHPPLPPLLIPHFLATLPCPPPSNRTQAHHSDKPPPLPPPPPPPFTVVEVNTNLENACGSPPDEQNAPPSNLKALKFVPLSVRPPLYVLPHV
ncbi:unnamed protein product [Ixodes persulcatus]